MLPGLKQFVPSQVCLSCDGCCRFKEAQSLWRPMITGQERDEQRNPDFARKVFSAQVVDDAGFITTLPLKDSFICYFLNPSHNTCGIYHARPFECQLYPFVLGRNSEESGVYAHLNCPYIQDSWDSPKFLEYKKDLQQFFRQDEVRAFLKRNPCLVREYQPFLDELEFLFPLSL
jgi:uncharacterized protein